MSSRQNRHPRRSSTLSARFRRAGDLVQLLLGRIDRDRWGRLRQGTFRSISGLIAMSVLVELNGKAGRLCTQALSGELRCPCIVRTTSEDVLTGEVFGALQHIRPHLWLGPLINLGTGSTVRHPVWYKDLSIRLWERQERFPPELLNFREGQSEPDVVIEWENPPTTVFIEAKYTSPLAAATTHSDQNDQVLRGIRTLLARTGHIRSPRLFGRPKRRPMWLALLAYKPEPLVDRYRNAASLASRLSGVVEPSDLPTHPFVGTITWSDTVRVLADRISHLTTTELSIQRTLAQYVEHKLTLPGQEGRLTGFQKALWPHPSAMLLA